MVAEAMNEDKLGLGLAIRLRSEKGAWLAKNKNIASEPLAGGDAYKPCFGVEGFVANLKRSLSLCHHLYSDFSSGLP